MYIYTIMLLGDIHQNKCFNTTNERGEFNVGEDSSGRKKFIYRLFAVSGSIRLTPTPPVQMLTL